MTTLKHFLEHQLPSEEEKGEGYKPSDALIGALEVALMLQKPLLITGEPGTGKSELAHYLRRQLDLEEVLEFVAKTDSSAKDLLYQYDSMAHFHKVNVVRDRELGHDDLAPLLKLEALGQAIQDSSEGKRRVVLIDEIDKAPRDLPNDILVTLEKMHFEINERKLTGKFEEHEWKIQGNPKFKPVVVITSNSEKTLPDAFLRRCVFFHIPFPTNDELQEILLSKKSLFPHSDPQEQARLVKVFRQIRNQASVKQPATHELILWVWWLEQKQLKAMDFVNFKTLQDKQEQLKSSLSILVKAHDDLSKASKLLDDGAIKLD